MWGLCLYTYTYMNVVQVLSHQVFLKRDIRHTGRTLRTNTNPLFYCRPSLIMPNTSLVNRQSSWYLILHPTTTNTTRITTPPPTNTK